MTVAIAPALVLALLFPGSPGHPSSLAVIGGILSMGLVSGGGQVLARRTASDAGRAAWGNGPALWDPQDARIWVPKAMGTGIGMNFAQAASWLLLLCLIGIPILLASLGG